MNEQDRNARRPSNGQEGIREPRIRRPELEGEDHAAADREAFFQDFDKHTGLGAQAQYTSVQDPAYEAGYRMRSETDYSSYDESSQPVQRDRGSTYEETDVYGAYDEAYPDGYAVRDDYSARDDYDARDGYDARDVYDAGDGYGARDAYDAGDGYGARDAYAPQEEPARRPPQAYESYDDDAYPPVRVRADEQAVPVVRSDDEAAPWSRLKKKRSEPREPNPFVEKAKKASQRSLTGVSTWVKLFLSGEPLRVVDRALLGEEKLSFIPVFLVLILLVPIQALLAFQTSAAGLNAQISAIQGVEPSLTPLRVYGSTLLRYLLESIIMTGLYLGLMKLMRREHKLEGAVNVVAVSYLPLIFLTPFAVILNYISAPPASALGASALVLQFIMLGSGLKENTFADDADSAKKVGSVFWLFAAFIVVSLIFRTLIIAWLQRTAMTI